MFKQIDRILLRVPNVASATAHYEKTLGLKLVREEKALSVFELEAGTQLVLHADADRPFEEIYYLVEDVRDLHKRRDELKLKFLESPRQVARGWRAIVKDPFGIVLQIIDRTAGGQRVEDAKPAAALFSGVEAPVKVNKQMLVDAYAKVGVTADDLPYTPQFETIYRTYLLGHEGSEPVRAEIWRQLLNIRKAGKLPKLGPARSVAPKISAELREKLKELLTDELGRRDRLPYTRKFDELVEEFNKLQRKPLSPHLVWRLVATLAK